jgi:hypothetical protein
MESIMKLPDDTDRQDLLPFLTAHDIAMLHEHRPIKNAETTEKWIFFVSCHKINFNKLINTMIHCHILSTLKAIRYY